MATSTDNAISTLPPGYTLETPSPANPQAPAAPSAGSQPSGVTPPPGYSLEAPGAGTPPPTTPSLGSKIVEGAKESAIGQMAAPPQNHIEAGIMTAGGPAALFAFRTAKGVYDTAAKLVTAEGPDQYMLAKEDFGKAVDEFHRGKTGTAALSAASGVTDIMGGMTPAAVPITSRVRELTEGAKPGGNLATPLTKDILDVGTAVALGKAGGEAEAPAAGAARVRFNPFRAAANKMMGADIQPTLQGGIRDVWNNVAQAEGVPKPLPGISVGEMGEQVADSIYARSKALYRQIDEATGGRFSGNEESLRAVNKDLRFVTNDTEEQNLLIRKQRLEMQQDQMFDEAAKKGVSKDTVAKAKADFKKAQAIYDTNAQIQASTTGVRPNMRGSMAVPEEVNPKTLMNRTNKLYNKGRLQEAIGEDNSADLIGHSAKAQKMARDVAARQRVASIAGHVVGYGAAGALGVEAVKHAVEP